MVIHESLGNSQIGHKRVKGTFGSRRRKARNRRVQRKLEKKE